MILITRFFIKEVDMSIFSRDLGCFNTLNIFCILHFTFCILHCSYGLKKYAHPSPPGTPSLLRAPAEPVPGWRTFFGRQGPGGGRVRAPQGRTRPAADRPPASADRTWPAASCPGRTCCSRRECSRG